jgi:lipid-binding SYLF domain-containing protein
MKTMIVALLVTTLALSFAPIGNADHAGKSKSDLIKLESEVKDAIALLKQTDPEMQTQFDKSHGYVVFPAVVKGAAGIGAAHGVGVVYERGARIGTAELTMATVGAQLGGQEYIEVIFFENKDSLDKFKQDKLALAAQASATAAASGAAANAKYEHGVLIFTLAKGGLMFEASVGGQKFKFTADELTAAK